MLLDIAMSLGGLISEPNGEAGQGRVEMPEDQQSPHPDPALNALDIMVGAWDLKGRDFVTNEKSADNPLLSGLKADFFWFTASTSITPAAGSRESSTSATMKRAVI